MNVKPTTVREVCKALDGIAPLHLAEDWDQVGLQVGDYDAKATKALVCIDYTPAVFKEAKAKACDFVVAYHPPMFKPLKRLTVNDGRGTLSYPRFWQQHLLVETLRRGISVYSPHTALDAVRGGFCDMLSDVIASGIDYDAVPIDAKQRVREQYKLVVFVPEAEEVALRDALSGAGAGSLGRYAECSFSSKGVGGFRPLEGANPAIGRVGEREEVPEVRLEMLVKDFDRFSVIEAFKGSTPL